MVILSVVVSISIVRISIFKASQNGTREILFLILYFFWRCVLCTFEIRNFNEFIILNEHKTLYKRIKNKHSSNVKPTTIK